MRKHKKQQILEFISTLHEAHEEIKTTPGIRRTAEKPKYVM